MNLLLFSLWLAMQGRALGEDGIAEADKRCAAWRDGVVKPLREQRRFWKDSAQHGKEYAAIKSLELEAERRQLEFLAALRDLVSKAPPAQTKAPPAQTKAPPAQTKAPPAQTKASPAQTTAQRALARDNLCVLMTHYEVAVPLADELAELLLDACLG